MNNSYYPDGMSSSDWGHVYGEQYVPDAPRPEKFTYDGEVIHFDYVVIPDGPYGDIEVQVEVTGIVSAGDAEVIDFERTRSFESVDDASDWVYSFDSFELSYDKVKEAIKNGD